MHRKLTAIILTLLLMAGAIGFSPVPALAVGMVDESTVITGEIKDAALLAVIRAELGKPEGDITVGDMKGITNLYAHGGGISDLSGLEYATNLNELDLSGNNISGLSPLSGLTNLKCLHLSENKISDISALSSLENLTSLDLSDNEISSIAALSSLNNLTALYLMGNNISDLSPLSGLTQLTVLSLNRNQISDIGALASLRNLTELYLCINRISDISALASLEKLERLGLIDNRISDINALSSLSNLFYLELCDNNISDISALASLDKLSALDLTNNNISDISPIESLRLFSLNVYNNYLNLADGTRTIDIIRNFMKSAIVYFAPQKTLSEMPFGAKAEAKGGRKVELSWDKIPDAVYEVTRKSGGETVTLMTGSTGTSFTDNGLLPGTEYTYIVRAHIWQGDGNPPVTIEASVSVTTDTVPQYTITASAGEHGSISPDGEVTVYDGDSITFTIAPDAGCRIKSVVVDGEDMGAVTSYKFDGVGASHTIRAEFEKMTYNITATAGKGGSISPGGTVSVTDGGSVTFTVTPSAGYRIKSVVVDGENKGAVPAYEFTNVAAPHTIHAAFEPVENGGGQSRRTLTDNTTGITVSGSFGEGAALVVKDMTLGNSPAEAAIRARMDDSDYSLIWSGDISITGSFSGTLIISLPVGEQYNGRTVIVMHAKQDGTLETYSVVVKDGRATFEVTSLSPFAVFLQEELDDLPETGDGGIPWAWWLLAGICLLPLRRKGLTWDK